MMPGLKKMSYDISNNSIRSLNTFDAAYIRIAKTSSGLLRVAMSMRQDSRGEITADEALLIVGHMQDALDHYKKLLNS